jgi:hypothetical protein
MMGIYLCLVTLVLAAADADIGFDCNVALLYFEDVEEAD